MPKESPSISNIWTQRSLGIDLRKNQESDDAVGVDYIRNNSYPFLQCINPDAVFAEETSVNLITASTGWIIHDYGDAISVSAPHDAKNKISTGTLEQATTASEIADLIASREWGSVEVIDGTKMMQRNLWIELKRYGIDLKVNGERYEPDSSDEKCYNLLMRRAQANGLPWEKQAPQKPARELTIAGGS